MLPTAEFEIVEILPSESHQDAESESSAIGATLIAFGKRLELDLRPGELVQPGSEVVWLAAGGVEYREPSETLTYSGVIRGEEDSIVRLISHRSGLEGVVVSQEGVLFLEPARRYLPNLPEEHTLAYRLDELEPFWKSSSCGADELDPVGETVPTSLLPENLQLAQSAEQGSLNADGLLEVELRLLVDHHYFRRHGWESVQRVQGVVHQANGIFEKEMGVTFRISETRVSTTSSEDPVTGITDAQQLLKQMASRNVAGGADLTHLFTARELDGETLGISWMGSVCKSSYAVGLTQDLTGGGARLVATAHELAHGLGARHDGIGYCLRTKPGWIMWPILTPQAQSFSDCSERLVDLTLARAACVAPISEDPLPAPEPIAPSGSVSPSSIRFEWGAVDGASAYVLELRQKSTSSLYEESTTATSLAPELEFKVGESYQWRVTAKDPGGSLGSRSSWREFIPLTSSWRNPRR